MTCPLLLRGHGESHPGVTSHGEEGTVPASSSEDAEKRVDLSPNVGRGNPKVCPLS